LSIDAIIDCNKYNLSSMQVSQKINWETKK
jgi:hypothetical protein